ncbi:lipase [Actinopolymorpha sp. NPDC004070]|uniref:alpha/beta hydrolase family protein n=1 Tax=Actinopolymorpha sp. NPDC004070 TaxID=3154548 RepID=UPI00339E3A87
MITTTLRRAAVTACVGLASLGLLAPGPARAGTPAHQADPPHAPSLTLPRPTGPYGVGTDTLHLVDAGRTDPWVPESGPRELMVSMYYPTRRGSGTTPARYVTPRESELILRSQGITDVPADILSSVHTYARSGAAPRAGRHTYPLVVLSPGFSFPRTSLTALAEDLASSGYVVATVEHTYESVATTFPDGHVTTCVACEREDLDPRQVVLGRAADVSFALDELVGPHPAWPLSGLIDPSRIGMAGHSIGGASGGTTAARDPRVRAVVNLDGTQFDPLPESGLDVPFLFVGTEDGHSPGGADTTWDRDWRRLTGWKRWITVGGAVHFSFTDYATLADQLGLDLGQTVAGDRAVRITNEYVGAFFDQHLRGRHRPLLDGPSRRYPEVRFRP